jgi:3-keto-disaccharide hydrolase
MSSSHQSRVSFGSVMLAAIAGLIGWPCVASGQGVGYSDTPLIPGQVWRVHDIERPNPPIVDPGPAPKEAGPVPSDAVVLFDGTNLDAWQHGNGSDARWILVDDGAMEVKPGTGDIRTREEFGDCQLHLEFATPAPKGESQGRGNSGVFFFGRYEVQILDSYENKTYADGQAAAIYGQYPPDVNACRGPGEWQTFDIVFEAPRFDEGGTLAKPAYVTVLHNGIVVHHRRELLGSTSHRSAPKYSAHGAEGSIKLQDHGNRMRFRNIWVRRLKPREDSMPLDGGDADVVEEADPQE